VRHADDPCTFGILDDVWDAVIAGIDGQESEAEVLPEGLGVARLRWLEERRAEVERVGLARGIHGLVHDARQYHRAITGPAHAPVNGVEAVVDALLELDAHRSVAEGEWPLAEEHQGSTHNVRSAKRRRRKVGYL
jgi:hypothetical protein